MPRKSIDAFLPQRLPRRERLVRIRVTEEERVALQRAAKKAGLELSTWLRAVGLRAAERK
jgi:uncharacterized protein (DUF1778 family)